MTTTAPKPLPTRLIAAFLSFVIVLPGPVCAQGLRGAFGPAARTFAPVAAPALPIAVVRPAAAAALPAVPAVSAAVQAEVAVRNMAARTPETALGAAFDRSALRAGNAAVPELGLPAAPRGPGLSMPSRSRLGISAVVPLVHAPLKVVASGYGWAVAIVGGVIASIAAAYLIKKSNSDDPIPSIAGSDTSFDSIFSPRNRRSGNNNEEKAQAPKVTFNDVAGQDEARAELEKVVDFLKDPAAYKAINPKVKGFKGVLLFGPPGTGKTLLARALANEANAAFVHRKGSDFINVYVGKGAANVREAFREIREKANGRPGILFIDEIEAVGGHRSGGPGGHDRQEEDRTIDALLAEIDGFEKDNIIVVAATNRPDMLDDALLRGGRFGLKVPVGKPDVAGREAILKIHTKGMALAPDVDLKLVAKQTPGLAGADLEEIVNDVTMMAGRRRAKQATTEDFAKAIDRFMIGHERRMVMNAEEKKTVAYHESGHALVSHLLPDADPVRKVTIVPTGLNALGLMQALPEEERHMQSYEWLRDRMAVAMGGRAAEHLATGKMYSGAQNDLEQATLIARHMVAKFGMSSEVGPVSHELDGARALETSETTRARIELEVKKLLDEALERARGVLSANRAVLDAMAKELFEKETLREADLERLIPSSNKGGPPPPSTPPTP